MDVFSHWLFWALLTPAFFAIVNLLDDNLLRKVYRSSYFAAIISGFFGFLPALLFPIVSFTIPPMFVLFLGILAGVCTVFYYLFYFKGLESEYPSVVIAMFALAPALIPFLSYFFLHEQLTKSEYLGK
jgi:drug/metabolite transporter (DMT)-like permease